MNKIYNISIVLSFASLWFTSIFTSETLLFLGFALIMSFGILHGSNDILLETSFKKQKKSNKSVIRFLFFYIFIIAVSVLIFYLYPFLALVLFILFSSFHFGEQHWENRHLGIDNNLSWLLMFFYGFFVLNLLFILNINDVIIIIEAITNFNLSTFYIKLVFIISFIIFSVFTIYLLFKSEIIKKTILREVFYLVLFAIIFKVSNLIWGFTIYFIFWHSLPSIYEQINFIYGKYNKKNVINYFRNAFPYWIISLVGIFIVYFIFKDTKIFHAIFFSFLAAITFPHTLIINKMHKNKKRNHF